VSEPTEAPALDPRPLAWITGAGGLIGNYLVQTAPSYGSKWRLRALTRQQVDLADFNGVERLFAQERPGLILHCAAMSRSPQCEREPEVAWRINFKVTQRLSELATNIPLLFFSSDLVFDGKKGNYVESDAPNPLTVYGETKVAAEEAVLKNPGHMVIRTTLNYGASPTGDRAFNEELRRTWERRETARLFIDEFRCPIPAELTARAVWELVDKGASGLYHVAGRERLSRLQIGRLIANHVPRVNARMEAASLREYRGAPRSPDTSLDCSKVQQLLSFDLPPFSQWLVRQTCS
jgi:dTDP-4-dehydrorhamnose reductase